MGSEKSYFEPPYYNAQNRPGAQGPEERETPVWQCTPMLQALTQLQS